MDRQTEMALTRLRAEMSGLTELLRGTATGGGAALQGQGDASAVALGQVAAQHKAMIEAAARDGVHAIDAAVSDAISRIQAFASAKLAEAGSAQVTPEESPEPPTLADVGRLAQQAVTEVNATKAAIALMLADDPEQMNDSWWTVTGKPECGELSRRVGRPVSATERDAAWADMPE